MRQKCAALFGVSTYVEMTARPVREYYRHGRPEGQDAETHGTESSPKQIATPPLSERLSIAVLPFQNLDGDPEQDYFADRVVEEIITGLARIKWLLVIARNSSFTYKGRVVDVKQIGRELLSRLVERIWSAVIAKYVPESCPPAARAKQKCDFGKCCVLFEPMKGCAADSKIKG